MTPKKINLGSGKDWSEDFINIDILERAKPDIRLDITLPLSSGVVFETERFGPVVLEESQFDLIVANDVLEHLDDLVQAMTNCLNLLRVGGVMKINVPYDLSFGAWQDPTHVRAFNERSWLYYSDWAWYVGWKDFRFEVTQLNFILSEFGRTLSLEKRSVEEITRTPRAVDSMAVELTKVVW